MEEYQKIPYYLYQEFEDNFFKEVDNIGKGQRNRNDLRFGQAFLNEFFPTVADPDLFYQEKIGVCIALILRDYVFWGKNV